MRVGVGQRKQWNGARFSGPVFFRCGSIDSEAVLPKNRIISVPVPDDIQSLRIADLVAFHEQRDWGYSMGPGKSPALVIVDFSVPFTRGTPDHPGGGYDDAISGAGILLRAARAAKAPVFFTTIAYEKHMLDAGLWVKKVPSIDTLQLDSSAMEIDDRLAPELGEAIIVKKYPSAFFGTDLRGQLELLGVDTIVLAGCTTSCCVRATAIEAMQLGLHTLVCTEAVGDFNPILHWLHLLDLASRYVDVSTLAKLVPYFESCGLLRESPGPVQSSAAGSSL